MKTISLWVGLCLATWQSQAQVAVNSTSVTQTNTIASQSIVGYQTGVQDGNSRVWQKIIQTTDAQGNITYQTNNAYTELATGLNHLVNGQWIPSSEEIDISADGNSALATNGQHQAYFPGDIYSGQIELVTPDGKQLYSRPVGLSYDDGTHTVLIAELTNSTGEVMGNNQVIYANAFTGFKADIRYTYTKAGFEQDIILRERPPTPASFGLNPDTAKLQVLTEFFNPPQPTITATTVSTAAGDLENDNLSFGTMAMVPGKAFMMGATTPSAAVEKQWLLLNNRQILVEEVPVSDIADELSQLPIPQTTSTQPNSPLNVVSTRRLLPQQRLATVPGKHTMQLAQAAPVSQGLVLDYNTVNTSLTNYTFQGDTTYYISGAVNLYGTNTFEGGTVIKYTNNATIHAISGPPVGINWLATAYRPVIFTAKDDNSVGDTISGSTGIPSDYYANPALTIVGNNTLPSHTLSYFRISYAQQALTLAGASSFNVDNGQIVNCQNGIYPNSTELLVENVLFANVQTNFNSVVDSALLTAENVTFSSSLYLTTVQDISGNNTTLTLTNCILANVYNLTNNHVNSFTYQVIGDHNGFYYSPAFGTVTNGSSSYPFQTVGAGSYYLTNGCNFFNAGTTNIDPTLLADLQQKTTYPPMVYSNVVITNNLTLGPQAQRDTDTPDLGYHYDPLDYVFGGSDLYTNLDFSAGTAVGWFASQGGVYSYGQAYGLSINDGAKVSFQGTATQPTFFLRFNWVQEGNGNWLTRAYMPGLMLNGSGSAPLPEINATFTKWEGGVDGVFFRDAWDYGVDYVSDSEFYGTSIATYGSSAYFTNCLFFRPAITFTGNTAPTSFTFFNSTFYDGYMLLQRYTGQSASFWRVNNSAFDGTSITTYDQLNADTNSTSIDYNSYNPSNADWIANPFSWYGAPKTNVLEVVGPQDITVTNYDWQSSWFGNYYLPPDSPLIDMGSTNANLLGLYHFTTQTNQAPETNSIVDIGYHYVATDTNGIPLDSNGDGIPDYIEDANGNGTVDSGEIGWNIYGDLGLNVIITRPRNGSVLP